MAEMVTVFGADGSEGNEVASALLQDGNFKLRAAVSELASPAAQHLQASGAQTVVVDYNQTSTIDSALRDAHKCFVVTDMDFNSTDPLWTEIQQGYRIADLCKKHKIKQVVFSGAHHVHRKYSLPARHMDAKACINDYMNEIALPKTEIIVPFYFENFLTTFKPTPSGKDTYKIAIPMGETAMDGISVKQIGPIVTALFKAPERWTGKSCFLSADRLEIKEYGQILSEYLDPKRIKDSRISVRNFVETFDGAGAQDLGNMFEFWKRGGQKMNRTLSLELHPELQSFRQWVSANTDLLREALDS
ncbi:nmrA-like family domain-containing protein 1 [Callorhinchus milii]|uniref:nmrA-like family domain-containing protein 1 n=1 Tax=Callorhinchus milii TaxID=7868 RepID=UPI00045740BC|nr:nmrA-like family domain-containing protein 1 [Callorhinchus milii]|eukprot:gi/632956276/ref/XP_007893877.1/ PREDICTED: nmrA-like family domain-containing protein 1 [Callorhinchus milii]